jgi:hypothetical protein
MEVERIHACLNDYILYEKEYSDMNICLKCKASWYKLKDNQVENEIDDNIDNKKRSATKVLWYLLIVPRFW